MRNGVVAVGCTVAILLAGARAAAQVPDTELRVTASAGGETESHDLSAVSIGSADVDYSISFEGGSATGTSHAVAGGGGGSLDDPPIAECEATASVTGPTALTVSADAFFVHYVKVNGAPPSEIAVYNPPVLARVIYRGETTLEGDIVNSSDNALYPSAAAYFSIYDGYPQLPGSPVMSENTGSTFASRLGDFSGVRTITIPAALLPYPMEVAIRCTLHFGVVGGTAHGRAMADPIFEFDQEAFDEYAAFAGFPTFPLADYYGFEYSESLVPEPARAAQALASIAALAVLVSAGSRRRRAA